MNMKSSIKGDPFFILSDGRSGSTFLANQLAKCAGIVIPPESQFITRLFTKYSGDTINHAASLKEVLDIVFAEEKFCDWEIDRKVIETECLKELPMSMRGFIYKIIDLYAVKHSAKAVLFGIKKNYIMQFGEIKKVFPESRAIALIRDGRAVFNSKKVSAHSRTKKPMGTDPVKVAGNWVMLIRELRHHEKSNKNIIFVKYERLIENFDNVMNEIYDFLGLSADERQIGGNGMHIPERYNGIHKNVNKAPLSSRIIAWQTELPRMEIAKYEAIAGPTLVSEGYTLVSLPGLRLLHRANHVAVKLLITVIILAILILMAL